jgi:N-acetylmuramic acid 6-phosphate etherase
VGHPAADQDGHDAFRDEIGALATEAVDESQRTLDLDSTASLVEKMNRGDQTVAQAVAAAAPAIAAAIDAIADRLRRGGRLVYVGAGTSGRLGILDASECPPTFGVDPSLVVGVIAGGDAAIRTAIEDAEDDEAAGEHDVRALDVSAADAVVGLSASGRTPYVAAALRAASEVGALTVAVACHRPSRIGALAEHSVEVPVGPEFIAGSTRLKAGTAQKLVLNMISTITMVRLGKTYGNVMVDLQPTNAKLRARAERAVMSITGVAAGTASAVLAATGWSVKEAVLALLTDCSPDEARARLALSSGDLRAALGEAAQA